MKSEPCVAPLRRRRGGAWALLAALCGGTLLSRQPARAVEINPILGFGQEVSFARARRSGHIPLTVQLSDFKGSGEAQVVATLRNGVRTDTYVRPVTYAAGQTSFARLVLNMHDARFFTGQNFDCELTVQLLAQGRNLGEKRIRLRSNLEQNTFALLSLSRDTKNLHVLRKYNLGLWHSMDGMSERDETERRDYDGAVNTEVLGAAPALLPDNPQGYAMIDAIVVGDYPLDQLSSEQVRALKEYVHRGGLLIVSNRFFPIRDNASAELVAFHKLDIIWKTSSVASALKARYGSAPASAQATRQAIVRVIQNGQVLMTGENGATPVLTRVGYGAGNVVYTSFDLYEREMAQWKAIGNFWFDLLRCREQGIKPAALLTNEGGYPSAESALENALAGKQATNAPEFSAILVFVLAYILLLVPVSYLVLKRLDRREWTWVTAPVLIIGFTGVSYAIGLSIKSGDLTVHRAAILQTRSNDSAASGVAAYTLYSPRRAQFDIDLGLGQNALDAPSDAFGGAYRPVNLTVEHGDRTLLRDVSVRMWDKRSFKTIFSADLGGAIETQARMIDAYNAELIIVNRTRYDLKDCHLVTRSESFPLGELKAGQRVTRILRWNTPAEATEAYRYPTILSQGGALPANRLDIAERIRQAMSEAWTGIAYDYNSSVAHTTEGFQRIAAPILTGWFDAPTLDVRVDGKPVKGTQVNLLVVHLESPQGVRKQDQNSPFAKPIFNMIQPMQRDNAGNPMPAPATPNAQEGAAE